MPCPPSNGALTSVSNLKRLIHSSKLSGAGTKIALLIGMSFIFRVEKSLTRGWEGSQWFSHVCSTAVNRTMFVEAIVNAVEMYGLDGQSSFLVFRLSDSSIVIFRG